MSVEYYFSKEMTLKSLRKKTKGLTITLHKQEGVAIIKDKYDNYLQAWGVTSEREAIKFFNSKDLSGGHIIARDIALQMNAMFITDESYFELSDTLEELGLAEFTFGDSYSMPYIVKDLKAHYLQFANKNNMLNIVSIVNIDYDTYRKKYAAYRNKKIQEEFERDQNALAKQIAKMNKTNIAKATIVAELDVELQESRTPKAHYV